ncbi:MAG: CRISPR-associated endonuclease Cas2 [Anaerolineae bacterium]|nr:CRISPR-associated endonuclease Cas2 [Anaerolineae bacterium]
MLYIVAYDIPNDRRRTKVHKALCGFGAWTQYSLFECFLDARELVRLRARLDDLLEPDEDSVRIYPLCQACQKSVETIGSPAPKESVTFIM